jgi:uncharacterized protein YqiB (DUF1249 family)
MQNSISPRSLNRFLRLRPTLGQLMDLCEENYALLLKLAPGLTKMTGHFHSLRQPETDLHLEIFEQSPYTTLLRLTHFFQETGEADPDITLRAYHDSRQLEIIDLKKKKLKINTYQQPGLMLKWKANLFINKWLQFCISQQHSFDPERQQPPRRHEKPVPVS